MRNRNTASKVVSIILAVTLMGLPLVGCNANKQPDSVEMSTEETAAAEARARLYAFPDECKLSDEEIQGTISAYAEYLTGAMSADEYTFSVRFEDDGTVHFDGERIASNGATIPVADVKVFDTLHDCYAYLYNNGQVDIDGNVLAILSEGLSEAVSIAGTAATSNAEAAVENSNSNSSSANTAD